MFMVALTICAMKLFDYYCINLLDLIFPYDITGESISISRLVESLKGSAMKGSSVIRKKKKHFQAGRCSNICPKPGA